MAARHEIVELDMSVDNALKMVISGGVVVPPWLDKPVVLTNEIQK